jgi:hypothetical protein
MKIEYNGKWPNLCSGDLIITVEGVRWEFPPLCLNVRGTLSQGWDMDRWPDNFPERLKVDVLKKVNEEIGWPCCGGCE